MNAKTAYKSFLQYYNEFKGDVNACLYLYNLYFYGQLAITKTETKNAKKKVVKNKSVN